MPRSRRPRSSRPPRAGTILCGRSREFTGFDTNTNAATLRRVLADCIGIVPDLARLRVIRAYAGLRPFSEDGYPLVGPLPGAERVIAATGHESGGHALAPVTGELVADCVCNGATHPYDGQLYPERFANR